MMSIHTDHPITERDPGFFEALREMEQDTELEDPIPHSSQRQSGECSGSWELSVVTHPPAGVR